MPNCFVFAQMPHSHRHVTPFHPHTKMQSSHRNILIAVFILVVAAMAAINWYTTREKTEEDLYAPAMAKLAQASSATLDLDVNTFLNPATFTGGKNSLMDSVDIPMTVSGSLALSFPVGGRVSGEANLDFEAGFGIAKLFHLDAVVTEIGRTYAKISDLPEELDDSLNVTDLGDVWFSVSGSDLGLLIPQLSSPEADPEPTDVLILTADAFRSAFAGMFVPYRRYENTVINGQASAHYEMLVDNSQLVDFLCVIAGTAHSGFCAPARKTAVGEYVHSRRFLAEAWISTVSGELQIIKLGIFPHNGAGGMPVVLTLALSDLGAPVTVIAPENASPISVVLMKVLRVPAASVGN